MGARPLHRRAVTAHRSGGAERVPARNGRPLVLRIDLMPIGYAFMGVGSP
jgi:hypothetical protein